MIAFCLLFTTLFVGSYPFGFIVEPKSERCFSEHMDEYVLTKGKYILIDNDAYGKEVVKFSVNVYDPSSKKLYSSTDLKTGKFVFNTPVSGSYNTCFTNDNIFPIELFFRYKFGTEAKDYSHLAQLQNLEEVEVQTQWIMDSLYEVQDTVDLIQEHEEEIRSIAKDLDSKLITFSIISIVILILISIGQTILLKRRLVKAKLL